MSEEQEGLTALLRYYGAWRWRDQQFMSDLRHLLERQRRTAGSPDTPSTDST